MDKTLESMKNELKRLEEAMDDAHWAYYQFNNKIVEYRLNNGLYHPMFKLVDYARKDIDCITMVIKNEDGILKTLKLCKDIDGDIECCIDASGHILFYSYSGNLIKYDDYTGRYIHAEGCIIDYYDFVGFMDLSFEIHERIDDIW